MGTVPASPARVRRWTWCTPGWATWPPRTPPRWPRRPRPAACGCSSEPTAMGTAARASILAAFTAAQGYSADADYSPAGLADPQDRDHPGAAVAHTAWVRRAAAHPLVAPSWPPGRCRSRSPGRSAPGRQAPRGLPPGRRRDPGHRREGRDGRAGPGRAGRGDLRPVPADPDQDKDQAFEDRSVRVETTFDGAGVLTGDLTPECASILATVLDALSAPAGAEDARSQAPSRPRSATRSSCATSTASGPGGATSPPRRARSTTSSTRRTAARPAPRLRPALLLPPPGRDPPVGLDAGPEPRRHHHRMEPRQDEGPAQPRPAGPPG